MVTITRTTEAMPLAAETDFVMSSASANQAKFSPNLSTVDWQMLTSQFEAGTPSTVLDSAAATENTAGTISNIMSSPPAKKVIRLVVKRPRTCTVSQSQISNVTSCPSSSQLTNYVASLHTHLSSQELVTSCTAMSSPGYLGSPEVGQLGSSDHLNNGNLSTLEGDSCMFLRCGKNEVQGQEMVDEEHSSTPDDSTTEFFTISNL